MNGGIAMYFQTEPITISDNQIRHWQIGALSLWVQRSDNGEWLVAHKYLSGTDETLVEAEVLKTEPPGLKWQRFALPETEPLLSLSPHMPDRPVIVRPETALNLATGGEGVFYALLPCWIRLIVGSSVKLADIPGVRMSNSWYGEPVDGILCYAMRTSARRTVQDLPSRPHRAVCTLRLRNQDSNHLEFKRVCVQVDPLAIYRGKDHLWTSEIGMTYLGSNEFSDFEIGTGPPAGDPDAVLITPAREEHDAQTFKSRLSAIRSLIS